MAFLPVSMANQEYWACYPMGSVHSWYFCRISMLLTLAMQHMEWRTYLQVRILENLR